jgi:radical SAM superfamily enzyme YgiQ (UPF0313 family)
MRKILFVVAPRWNEVIYPFRSIISGVPALPPMGILCVASYLARHADVRIRLFDYAAAAQGDLRAIDATLEEFCPDIVGLSAYTTLLYDTLAICRHVKRQLPGAKVVLGGKHAELYPGETLAHACVDYVVAGEGERPMKLLVDALDAHDEKPAIGGVWWRDGRRIREGGHAPRNRDLDGLPFPDTSLLPRTAYGYQFGTGQPEAVMITSRGCTMKCAYCLSAHADRRLVSRSAANIVAEARELKRQGFGLVHFMDDNFNATASRAKAVCRALIDAGALVKWTMRGSARGIDPALATLMAAAGCERANLGVESANEDLLATFGRASSTRQTRSAIELLSAQGLTTGGYFMLGFPAETRAMAMRTIELAASLPLDYAQFAPLVPGPGTLFYQDLVTCGKIADVWRSFASSPPASFTVPYYEDRLTSGEVINLCRLAYASFYFRPSLVRRHLAKLRSPGELIRKGRVAADLLRNVVVGSDLDPVRPTR